MVAFLRSVLGGMGWIPRHFCRNSVRCLLDSVSLPLEFMGGVAAQSLSRACSIALISSEVILS